MAALLPHVIGFRIPPDEIVGRGSIEALSGKLISNEV